MMLLKASSRRFYVILPSCGTNWLLHTTAVCQLCGKVGHTVKGQYFEVTKEKKRKEKKRKEKKRKEKK